MESARRRRPDHKLGTEAHLTRASPWVAEYVEQQLDRGRADLARPSVAARSSAPRAISAKNGFAESSTTRPIEQLRPARSCRAASLRTKPSRSIAACTRATVSGPTLSDRLRTFDTMPTETDAAAATSFTLTFTVSLTDIAT